MRSGDRRRLLLVLLLAGALVGCLNRSMAAQPPAKLGEQWLDNLRVGFKGTYKVGHWTPVWVGASSGELANDSQLGITTTDSDGVEMTVVVPTASSGGSPDSVESGSHLLYTQVGRLDSPIRVALTTDGKTSRREAFAPRDLLPDDTPLLPLLSTSELVVQLGAAELGLVDALPNREATERSLGRRVVALDRIEELPTDWIGYDAVDVIVLATADAEFCQALAADARRLAAINEWLELDGNLVIVGSQNTGELLAPGQPLARFLPGEFRETVRLPQTRGLETFAEATDPIGSATERLSIPVPWLDNVSGRVEVYGRDQDLPLVVRQPRGFGELTYVGVDLDAPPLADWPGRTAFLQALLRPYAADLDVDPSLVLVSLGYDDLVGAVRQELGRSFAGVVLIAFPVVTVLVIGYLLLIGPIDYLFVHKLVGRPWVAWVTFPLLLIIACGAVLWLVPARRGSGGVRMNHAELIDVDLSTSQVRGSMWAVLYSPDARRFNPQVAPQARAIDAADAKSEISCFGLPGSGLGGMHARGIDMDVIGTGYELADNLESLCGVPVLTASTKSLTARWTATAAEPIAAELSPNHDDLLVGTLTNRTDVTLHDAWLLYGRWTYRLRDIKAGERIDVGPRLDTLQVKTLIAGRAGQSGQRSVAGGASELFFADRASTDELLNVMMFYGAVGGESFARLPFRYQRDCDLSRLLTMGRAILLARSDEAGSEWIEQTTGEPLSDEPGNTTVFCRFVIPIEESR